MPSIIQKALLLESLLNIVGIIALTCFPSNTLPYFLIASASPTSITPTAALLTRVIGLLFAALTFQILFAYPDSPDRVGQRKVVYFTLGVGEALLIPLLIREAFRATDVEKTEQGWGFSQRAALTCAANLVPLVAWRLWVWFVRPEWFDGADSGVDRKIKGKEE